MTIQHEWGPGEIIGGHRLLRRLGIGESAEVWLGAPALAEDGERVALKLIKSTAPPERASREAEALWRARGPHVVRLRDAVPHSSGTPFLIMDAVPHELHTVLSRGLSPGAAVTVLVPIAQELGRLHALGVTHGGLRLAAIGLDGRGSPVLLGFGAAVSGLVTAARRQADCAAFAALALVVLAAVQERRRDDEWRRLAAWFGASLTADEDWLAECIERCYRLADPQPVALASAERLSDVVQAAAAGSAFDLQLSTQARRPRAVIERMRDLSALLKARFIGKSARVASAAPTSASTSKSARVRARFWVPAAVAATGLIAVFFAPLAGAAGAAEIPTAPMAPASRTPTSTPTSTPTPTPTPTPARTPPPTSQPTSVPTARVVDELGGAFIVEIDGPHGQEQLVLVAGPEGWEVRSYLATDGTPATAKQEP